MGSPPSSTNMPSAHKGTRESMHRYQKRTFTVPNRPSSSRRIVISFCADRRYNGGSRRTCRHSHKHRRRHRHRHTQMQTQKLRHTKATDIDQSPTLQHKSFNQIAVPCTRFLYSARRFFRERAEWNEKESFDQLQCMDFVVFSILGLDHFSIGTRPQKLHNSVSTLCEGRLPINLVP
jgi:hypothetical protein